MSVLVEQYPDLRRVFPQYSDTHQMGMAFADEFIAAWGEPEKKTLSWWNLWPGNWPFAPQYLWSWELSGKEVKCRIDHPFYEAWEKTVCNCQILEAPNLPPAQQGAQADGHAFGVTVGLAEALGVIT